MIQNIFKGIAAYRNSFGLIRKLRLWKFFAIPIGISFLTAGFIIFSAFQFGKTVGGWLSKVWFWEWGAESFRTAGNIAGGFLIAILGLIIYRHIIMAFSAPFMSPVSEKIEKYVYPHSEFPEQSGFFKLLWRGIRINIRNLILELAITLPVFILGFIPVIGIISAPILMGIQSYYAGFGNMDYTLERHYTYKESIRFVRRNRGMAIGNGLVFMLVLMIPVIGLILILPVSVTAATKNTLECMAKEREAIKEMGS